MYFKSTPSGVVCASFCSGSLIARDAVLTAGHCLYDVEESIYKAPVSTVPMENMFALIGSSDFRNFTPAGNDEFGRILWKNFAVFYGPECLPT
jgi:V8-like Glu-specific endopeptidase